MVLTLPFRLCFVGTLGQCRVQLIPPMNNWVRLSGLVLDRGYMEALSELILFIDLFLHLYFCL